MTQADISWYGSEGFILSVSPRIFPGRTAGGASPVRSPQQARKLLPPLPAHLYPPRGFGDRIRV